MVICCYFDNLENTTRSLFKRCQCHFVIFRAQLVITLILHFLEVLQIVADKRSFFINCFECFRLWDSLDCGEDLFLRLKSSYLTGRGSWEIGHCSASIPGVSSWVEHCRCFWSSLPTETRCFWMEPGCKLICKTRVYRLSDFIFIIKVLLELHILVSQLLISLL